MSKSQLIAGAFLVTLVGTSAQGAEIQLRLGSMSVSDPGIYSVASDTMLTTSSFRLRVPSSMRPSLHFVLGYQRTDDGTSTYDEYYGVMDEDESYYSRNLYRSLTLNSLEAGVVLEGNLFPSLHSYVSLTAQGVHGRIQLEDELTGWDYYDPADLDAEVPLYERAPSEATAYSAGIRASVGVVLRFRPWKKQQACGYANSEYLAQGTWEAPRAPVPAVPPVAKPEEAAPVASIPAVATESAPVIPEVPASADASPVAQAEGPVVEAALLEPVSVTPNSSETGASSGADPLVLSGVSPLAVGSSQSAPAAVAASPSGDPSHAPSTSEAAASKVPLREGGGDVTRDFKPERAAGRRFGWGLQAEVGYQAMLGMNFDELGSLQLGGLQMHVGVLVEF